MMFKALTLCLLCISFVAQSQDEYRSSLLIPYSDHGVWGWSDTLGNVLIPPTYLETNFFLSSKSNAVAAVKTMDGKSNYHLRGKGLASPEGCDIDLESFHQSNLRRNNLSICINSKGNKGLYDYMARKFVAKMDYSEIFHQEGSDIFLKRNKKGIFKVDFTSKKVVKTNFVDVVMEFEVVRDHYTYVQNHLLFKDKKENWFEYKNGEFEPIYREKGPEVEGVENNNASDRPQIMVAMPPPGPQAMQNGLIYTNYKTVNGKRTYKIITKGGKDYYIFREDGKFGLQLSNRQLLPSIYDFIDPDYFEGYFVLIKEGKVGVFVPNTSYGIIETKYDFISLKRSLGVSSKWVFGVYEISINGRTGFVGENGVEYFNFD